MFSSVAAGDSRDPGKALSNTSLPRSAEHQRRRPLGPCSEYSSVMPRENDSDRDDLAELQRRRALTEDAARPDAVSKRHDRGGRTARENVADLIDEGSWVEYGRYAIAQQRTRRSPDDLIANTPGDGLVAGTATVGGSPIAVLAYDYTVLAGT